RGPRGLVVGVDLVALPADVDRALGGIGIGRRQRGAHVLETDAVLEQRARVQLDAHRRQRAAADLYLADAAHLREVLGQDGLGGVVQLTRRQGAGGEGEDEDRRVGRIHL